VQGAKKGGRFLPIVETWVSLSEVDPNTITLMHQSGEGGPWEPVESKIKVVRMHKKAGTAKLKIKAKLPGFSRYALAGSRQ